jgi:hypothetical protein
MTFAGFGHFHADVNDPGRKAFATTIDDIIRGAAVNNQTVSDEQIANRVCPRFGINQASVLKVRLHTIPFGRAGRIRKPF